MEGSYVTSQSSRYLSLVASSASHSTQPISLSHLAELNFSSILFAFSFVVYSNAIRFLHHYVIACMFAFSSPVSNKHNRSCRSFPTVSVDFYATVIKNAFSAVERSDMVEN